LQRLPVGKGSETQAFGIFTEESGQGIATVTSFALGEFDSEELSEGGAYDPSWRGDMTTC